VQLIATHYNAHGQIGLVWGIRVRWSRITLLSCFAVLGCALGAEQQKEQQQKKMEAALTPYVGKTIADYVLARGAPTSTIDMGPSKRGFQWVFTAQTAGAVVPLGSALVTVPPRQETCRVSFVANSNKQAPSMPDWIIESWQWNGAC
jgi:hypothetical protein